MTTSKIQPADIIHWLADGLTYHVSDSWHTGEVSRRGQCTVLTADMISANSDRNGKSFLDMVDDPDAQLKMWGRVYFGRGEFPATEPLHIRGTPGWERAREDSRVAAWAIPDETARAKALRAVVTDFGPAPTGQQTVEYRGSTALPAREQG